LIHHELGLDLKGVLCHTQLVERCVKAVTEASIALCGDGDRNEFILNIIRSTQTMPKFRTKKDFCLAKYRYEFFIVIVLKNVVFLFVLDPTLARIET